MYLMYADESGDCGMQGSQTRYFALSGIVLHESNWRQCLDQIVEFRRRMRATYGLYTREEIHCGVMINRPGELIRIKRHNRLAIIRAFADELAKMTYIRVINILVDKQGKPVDYDPFNAAWRALIQRFENTINRHNFPGPPDIDNCGILFPDNTDNKKLRRILRMMRRYNPVPNQPQWGVGYRNMALRVIIEDPGFKDSVDSFFIQAADLAAFLLYQKHSPSGYMRKKAGHNYFERLDPILCRVACANDPQGVVRL